MVVLNSITAIIHAAPLGSSNSNSRHTASRLPFIEVRNVCGQDFNTPENITIVAEKQILARLLSFRSCYRWAEGPSFPQVYEVLNLSGVKCGGQVLAGSVAAFLHNIPEYLGRYGKNGPSTSQGATTVCPGIHGTPSGVGGNGMVRLGCFHDVTYSISAGVLL